MSGKMVCISETHWKHFYILEAESNLWHSRNAYISQSFKVIMHSLLILIAVGPKIYKMNIILYLISLHLFCEVYVVCKHLWELQ